MAEVRIERKEDFEKALRKFNMQCKREGILQEFRERLARLGKPVVTKEDWQQIEVSEQAEAERLGLEAFKFGTNEELLAAASLSVRRPTD